MANIEVNSHDHKGNYFGDIIDWSFRAKDLDKRIARSGLLILSGFSFLMALAVLVLSFI